MRKEEDKDCDGNFLEPPDLTTLSKERLERYESVRDAIRHAWSGYREGVLKKHSYAKTFLGILPADDLAPMNNDDGDGDGDGGGGLTWLYSAATLFDSLDTLYLAGWMEEYKDAKTSALSLPLPIWPTKTFEYSIRVLGGLLGGFAVSGHVDLLNRAQQIANALLDGPFRSSPTPLPRKYDVLAPSSTINLWWNWGGRLVHRTYAWIYRRIRDRMGEHQTNSLAGVGSFTLEFTYLSHLTNAPTYKEHSDAIFQHVNTPDGVVPMLWDVMTGQPFYYSHSSLGSGCDSYYEYLGKLPLLLQETNRDHHKNNNMVDQKMAQSYIQAIDYLLFSAHKQTHVWNNDGNIEIPVESYNDKTYQHLLCYVPGLLALHAHYYYDDETEEKINYNHSIEEMQQKDKNMKLAKRLLNGCWDIYNSTATGLASETLLLLEPNERRVLDSGYYLRPEFVESIFVLYRITGDQRYQEIAWNVFQSIEKHCRQPLGYVGLRNVDSQKTDDENKVNEMPSFFIAETLKYLLLTFAPDDYVSLDEYVFTTEAHPLRRLPFENPKCFEKSLQSSSHEPVAPIFAFASNLLLGFLLFKVLRSRFQKRKEMKLKTKKHK